MLLWRETIPDSWLPKVRTDLGAVLVDHAHLERKAATSALNLEKYVELHDHVSELNTIAIEELSTSNSSSACCASAVCEILQPAAQPWIAGMMQAIAKGGNTRSSTTSSPARSSKAAPARNSKFLARESATSIPASPIFTRASSKAKATTTPAYLIMARHIDEPETDRRLDFFLDLDAKLILEPNPLPMLH
jgi:tRNA-(ms[2]io[6]A)-hydroxylase